jgi:hypothetical protein
MLGYVDSLFDFVKAQAIRDQLFDTQIPAEHKARRLSLQFDVSAIRTQ